jgi:exodeoxyribonuclease VII large subunit
MVQRQNHLITRRISVTVPAVFKNEWLVRNNSDRNDKTAGKAMLFPDDVFNRDIWTVTRLTSELKNLLETRFGLIWLSGEISNFKRPSSGHWYFTLKDEGAQVKAVMFRNKQRYLDFDLEDGREVLVRGRLSVYEPRGEYQLIVEYMEPRGEGALRLAFEKLKQRLAGEGLFDEHRKKPLPFIPQRVALVTSPTGAAVRDFIRVARRRFDNAGLLVYPVRVQGESAASEIATAVNDLNQWADCDVIVLTRGGGSLEDLWAFNEEIVARAVAASTIPVVSAVGHEIDFTICDFAADLRAPTPSAAAELIFREKMELRAYLDRTLQRLKADARNKVSWLREKLDHLQTRLGDPKRSLYDRRLLLDDLTEDLILKARRGLEQRRNRLEIDRTRLRPLNPRTRLNINRTRLAVARRDLVRQGKNTMAGHREYLDRLMERLNDLSPLAVLDRGYALARFGPDRKTLRSAIQVRPGDKVDLILAEGRLVMTVDEVIS